MHNLEREQGGKWLENRDSKIINFSEYECKVYETLCVSRHIDDVGL